MTTEEIQEWKSYPATKALLNELKSRVREGQEDWVAKAFQRPTIEETALANATALGGMEVLKALIDFLED